VKRYPVISAKNQSAADADGLLMRMIAATNINAIGPTRENGIQRQTQIDKAGANTSSLVADHGMKHLTATHPTVQTKNVASMRTLETGNNNKVAVPDTLSFLIAHTLMSSLAFYGFSFVDHS
jgi:hypothetical protein